MRFIHHARPYELMRHLLVLILALGVIAGPGSGLIGLDDEAWARKKRRATPSKPPELKILDIDITPIPYRPQDGTLEFNVTVNLPVHVQPTALLEVTALISSPSRSSLRFLSYRESVEPLLNTSTGSASPARTSSETTSSPRVQITLRWDGKDHTKQGVSPGTYHYELRAKVIGQGTNTPRALTVSWPKRGTLTIK